MIEQRVTLRYGAQQIPAIVQAVQGDTGRDVIFELADYEIPTGATANYYIDKPDGNAVYNSAEVISSTEILAHLTEQALAEPGRNNGQVRILSDGEVITSFDFVLEVEAFRGILRLQSETEVNIFDEALQLAAEDAIAEIQAQTQVVTGMQNSIASSYDNTKTYAVGDYVMYNAQLYRCNTAITTPETWTAEHWTQVPLANDVSVLKESIDIERYKTDSFTDPINLFEMSSDTLLGKYYNTQNQLVSNYLLGQTQLIPVKAGNKYTTQNVNFSVVWYDSTNAFIGYKSSADFARDGYAKAPANAAYGRFIFLLSDKEIFYVYDVSEPDVWISKKIGPEDTSFFEKIEYTNLFEQTSDTLIGEYYNSLNVLVSNSAFGQTQMLEVTPKHRYKSSDLRFFVNWYDENENLLSSLGSSEYNLYGFAQAVDGAKYARFMFYVSDVGSFYVHDLDDPQYQIYDKYIHIDEIEVNTYNISGFKSKKWVSFGDSITARNTWQPTIADLLLLDHTNCGIGSTAVSGGYVGGDTSRPSFWMPVRLQSVKSADPDLITILGGANDVVQPDLVIGTDAELTYGAPSDSMASSQADEYDEAESYASGDYCLHNSEKYECVSDTQGAWDGTKWKHVKNVDSFIGAYSYIIENLLNWKRKISIVILGTTYAHNDGAGYGHGITYTMLSEACKKVAAFYGLPFCDLHALLGYNKFTVGNGENAVYSDDGIHPNAEGSKQLTKVVLNTLINNVIIH